MSANIVRIDKVGGLITPKIGVTKDAIIAAMVAGDGKFLADSYLQQKLVRSKETKRTYRKSILAFFSWLKRVGRQFVGVEKDDLVLYTEDLAESGHAQSTINTYTVTLRGFFEWLDEQGVYSNVAAKMKTFRENGIDGHVKMHLSDEQVCNVLKAVQEQSLRDYVIINLMIFRGLRTVEISRANIEDIRFINGVRILAIQGKGHREKSRMVTLSDDLFAILKEYLSHRSGALGGAPLFVGESRNRKGRRLSPRTIQYIGKSALRKAGIDSRYFTTHSFRHTAGVSIIRNGGNIYDVQQILGHSSTATSEIYLKSAENELRLKNPPERFLDNAFKNYQSSDTYHGNA